MLLRSLRSNLISPLISIQNRSFIYRKNSRSFLSDKDRVRDFIALLGHKERQYLYEELNRLQNVKKEGNADQMIVIAPSFSELRQVFFNHSLPFIGFGFLDNLIMIVAGDYIDATIGVTLGLFHSYTPYKTHFSAEPSGISTMAAAGLGNALSDVAGIGSAFYVEQFAAKIGVKSPELSIAQLQMTRTRWAIQLGRAFGVGIGCIIGMFPLLFLPTKDKDSDSKSK